MSIVAGDLIFLGALNRPQDDISDSGGGIDVDYRPTFTQLAATDDLEVLSSSVLDITQTVTVLGRNAAGELVTRTADLNGTTPVAVDGGGAVNFERVLDVSMDGDAAGVVTLRRGSGGSTVGTIPIGERGFFAMFIDSTSAAADQYRFEKIFAKNTHGTLTLSNSTITLTADPGADSDHNILIAVNDALGGTDNESVRLAAALGGAGDPADDFGLAWVDDNVAVDVPAGGDGNLPAGSTIAIWIQQFLNSNAAALKSTFTIQLAGTTT